VTPSAPWTGASRRDHPEPTQGAGLTTADNEPSDQATNGSKTRRHFTDGPQQDDMTLQRTVQPTMPGPPDVAEPSGQRRPTLELLLGLSQAYRVPLDDLVGAPEVGDPRIRLKAGGSRAGRSSR
jgi:hypothetical protein